jgi:DnaJ-class molecular chaperone
MISIAKWRRRMDTILMPKSLTAENGAKAALMGEFHIPVPMTCEECGGDGLDEAEEDGRCIFCDGSGQINFSVNVPWTTIKAIYAKAVQHFTSTEQS